MPQSKCEMCKGQRTTRSQLFPSTLWVLEMNLGPQFGSKFLYTLSLLVPMECFLNSLLVYCI